MLKVVLWGSEDDYEKGRLGRSTGRDTDATAVNEQSDRTCELHSEMLLQHGNGKQFPAPFELRGVRSAHDQDILCEKVESAKAAPAPAKKGKAK